VTAARETVLDLLDALVRIDSVNPGLDPAAPTAPTAPTGPAGAGEGRIAAFVAEWGRRAGLRVTELQGTPGRPSVILRGGRDAADAGIGGEVIVAAVAGNSAADPTRSSDRATCTRP
jgi:acetylornithine deacetylase/succinyl-diaminopimelate desuccinylase-like protein